MGEHDDEQQVGEVGQPNLERLTNRKRLFKKKKNNNNKKSDGGVDNSHGDEPGTSENITASSPYDDSETSLYDDFVNDEENDKEISNQTCSGYARDDDNDNRVSLNRNDNSIGTSTNVAATDSNVSSFDSMLNSIIKPFSNMFSSTLDDNHNDDTDTIKTTTINTTSSIESELPLPERRYMNDNTNCSPSTSSNSRLSSNTVYETPPSSLASSIVDKEDEYDDDDDDDNDVITSSRLNHNYNDINYGNNQTTAIDELDTTCIDNDGKGTSVVKINSKCHSWDENNDAENEVIDLCGETSSHDIKQNRCSFHRQTPPKTRFYPHSEKEFIEDDLPDTNHDDDEKDDNDGGEYSLLSHQHSGIAWLMDLHCGRITSKFQQQTPPNNNNHLKPCLSFGGLLADEMGMGKTMTVCVFLKKIIMLHKSGEDTHNAMIVVPKSLVSVWQNELIRCGVESHCVHQLVNGKDCHAVLTRVMSNRRRGSIVITTYGIVTHNYDLLSLQSSESTRTPPTESKNSSENETILKRWSWIILDEGHEIKNMQTKVSQRIRTIPCVRRLLITGTPVQNNLGELYSLFDFVCPGLLGNDQRQFMERFAKVIRWGVDRDASNHEREMARKRAERLREIYGPFFLRRMKNDTFHRNTTATKAPSIDRESAELSEKCDTATSNIAACEIDGRNSNSNSNSNSSSSTLPDFEAQKNESTTISLGNKNDVVLWLRMTPLQRRVYRTCLGQDEGGSESKSLNSSGIDLEDDVLNNTAKNSLARLALLKKACNSVEMINGNIQEMREGLPFDANKKLDVDGLSDPESKKTCDLTNDQDVTSISLSHIGLSERLSASVKLSLLINLIDHLYCRGHRSLVFSASRVFLDIVEKCLEQRNAQKSENTRSSSHLRSIRIDGTISDHAERQHRVDQFNNDSSIACCLLTTKVGGFGITLTGADRVILLDPSWNPSSDNQAVDRCYRIGQERDVIVYRFITCGTIEEKIYRRQVVKHALLRTSCASSSFSSSSSSSSSSFSPLEPSLSSTPPSDSTTVSPESSDGSHMTQSRTKHSSSKGGNDTNDVIKSEIDQYRYFSSDELAIRLKSTSGGQDAEARAEAEINTFNNKASSHNLSTGIDAKYDVSNTQRMLAAVHDNYSRAHGAECIDLKSELSFLQTNASVSEFVFGTSDHDLLYSREAQQESGTGVAASCDEMDRQWRAPNSGRKHHSGPSSTIRRNNMKGIRSRSGRGGSHVWHGSGRTGIGSADIRGDSLLDVAGRALTPIKPSSSQIPPIDIRASVTPTPVKKTKSLLSELDTTRADIEKKNRLLRDFSSNLPDKGNRVKDQIASQAKKEQQIIEELKSLSLNL